MTFTDILPLPFQEAKARIERLEEKLEVMACGQKATNAGELRTRAAAWKANQDGFKKWEAFFALEVDETGPA